MLKQVRLEGDLWCEVFREGVLIKKTGITKSLFVNNVEIPKVGFNLGQGNGVKVNIGMKEFKYKPEKLCGAQKVMKRVQWQPIRVIYE